MSEMYGENVRNPEEKRAFVLTELKELFVGDSPTIARDVLPSPDGDPMHETSVSVRYGVVAYPFYHEGDKPYAGTFVEVIQRFSMAEPDSRYSVMLWRTGEVPNQQEYRLGVPMEKQELTQETAFHDEWVLEVLERVSELDRWDAASAYVTLNKLKARQGGSGSRAKRLGRLGMLWRNRREK